MWRACLFALTAFLSSAAFAALELLPGSSPQRAGYLQEFGPIRVRVTDGAGLAVAQARARFYLQTFVPVLQPVVLTGCTRDLGLSCEVVADNQGIAQLHTLRGIWPGTHSFRVWGYLPGEGSAILGEATVVLTVDAPVDAPLPSIVSGSGQRAVTGAILDPLVVRVVDAAGQPVAGVEVMFSSGGPTRLIFPGAYPTSAGVVTDSNGIAASPAPRAGLGIGPGQAAAFVRPTPGAPYTLRLPFDFTITDPEGRTELALQDMWWSGFDENGWGVSIAQHGDRLFPVIYAYDAQGRPIWHAVPGGTWRDRFATFEGSAPSTRGSPFFDYDRSRLQLWPGIQSLKLFFDGASAAILQIGVAPATSEKRLARQDFTSDTPAPLQGLADMWWGGENQWGWGIALMEQPGGLFSVWFTYDEQGLPTWFAMPSGSWTNPSTFEGTIFRTSGPSWPAYDRAKLRVTPVGSFAYRFRDRDHATFSYSVDGHSGSMEITRQPF